MSKRLAPAPVASGQPEAPAPAAPGLADLQVWLLPWVATLALLLVVATAANVPLLLAMRDLLLPAGATFWSASTLLGDALVAPLLVVPFQRRRPSLVWESVLAALFATAFTHGLKPLFHQARPPAVLHDLVVIGPRLLAGSFPSGHTTTAFTVLGVLVLAGLVRRPLPRALALALACLVGCSRVVVGAHWPGDVLAGAAGGWLCAALGLAVAARWPLAPQGWFARSLPALLVLIALFDLFGHDTGYPAGMVLQHLVALLALCWFAGNAWHKLKQGQFK